MPEVQERRKYRRTLMCLLRCFLSVAYLWLMLQAAAVVPLVREKHKWFLWLRYLNFLVTYSSLLTFDVRTQGYVIFVILMMLFRIYQCSRCNFCNPSDEVQGERVPMNKRMFVYFGPYLLMFITCWLASMYSLVCSLIQLTRNVDDIQPDNICKIIMTILFKLLIMANAITRCIRATVLLQIFFDEPGEELHNTHNLGEHFSLFFLN
ncbi:uncharacterized protein LOC6580302 [Drosophila mojavensis]|uniref:Uncharacterized protein n=1 Tax=Drosophila mojavensis TaxID=7230 RepID=B4KP20_DROMO|nr:uncharacterized protein LOC6580302 [Drosophila mojavensis]EDW10086.1 uncharacterized protein Dmoj_GI18718 [Drosophila mojavensis]